MDRLLVLLLLLFPPACCTVDAEAFWLHVLVKA
jgi:hypothetical protein